MYKKERNLGLVLRLLIMQIENRLALSLMAKMREIVNLGRMEEEVKRVCKCFFLFDLLCLLLRTGLLKH